MYSSRIYGIHLLSLSALYQEIYLEDVTAAELTNKLADLFSVPANHILRISRTGPHGIHILLSDMVSARHGAM